MALPAGKLHGMSRVEHDRVAKLFHLRNAAKIHNKILITEGRAPLRENYFCVSGGRDFFDRIFHVGGRNELRFLYINDASGFSGGDEQIRLTCKECRDLQNVSDFSSGRRMRGFVNVGEDGKF